MSNFSTGLFTLLGALGAIWLKDHLDQKKASKSTRKEKAVEAYALTGKLMRSLTALKVICSNLIQDKNFSYTDFYKNNPDTSTETLEKLELIVVENFYDPTTRQELLEVEKAITFYSNYLYTIITTLPNHEPPLNDETFKKKINEFDQTLIQSCHNLRNNIINKYINQTAPRATFYTLLEDAKQHFKLFFTK
jgi:hypothetical protein